MGIILGSIGIKLSHKLGLNWISSLDFHWYFLKKAFIRGFFRFQLKK